MAIRSYVCGAMLVGVIACGTAVDSGVEPDDSCPQDEPNYYGSVACTDAQLVCHYTRDDGCPTVRSCELAGGSGWSFTNHPADGTSCDQPGQQCFYPSGDCGGKEYTAQCTDGTWAVNYESDGCF